ncbi:GTP cyclohydrolase III [Halanaeroarchaeum sulfurireducens]|uniref:GTP cyclohydrolase III n=1 Tax=Halanaeroarchaeum sulfurireducens TaxID=1604004 RepID=A0A0F7PEL6_9EURY|nr:GTP cyclohydrolase III [Halanaeroarchaeum sulfurireducens]AKH98034.1 GTP cyclohydrolase III [Halanaeroarchaeum sulfurireducens]ALG82428.1 GTP cyclohydrolase III [Halanaeroarchaeum sulfurireducens]
MSNTQVTLIQIDNYGPWTVTPAPRREVDLQTMQSRLFADLSQHFGMQGGYAFFTRFDNMVAITNGMDLEDHARIQESVRNRYPVTVSFGVGHDERPARALVEATAQLQDEGSAQDEQRTEVLRGQPIEDDERTDSDVQIAHYDVVDATGKYTDELDAFSTFIQIEQGYASLMRHLHDEHGSLAFFVGGDNIIALTSGMDDAAFEETVTYVREDADVELQVGVGHGATAHDAGMAAKHGLETCRERGTHIEGEFC